MTAAPEGTGEERTPAAARDMRVLDPAELVAVAGGHAHPLLFATVSGAHLYGFPSVDSDVDLRGVHLLSLRELVALRPGPATVTRTWEHEGAEIDLVTHELGKFAGLLLTRNGYVLEQVLSPLVVVTGNGHRTLCDLARRCVTRHHARHYQGFARTQRRLFEQTGGLKPLLYTYRVLLTGIHLMRTGEVVAHLPTLRERVAEAPEHLAALIEAKAAREHGPLPGVQPGGALRMAGADRFAADLDRLDGILAAAAATTDLPDQPDARDDVEEFVITTRLAGA